MGYQGEVEHLRAMINRMQADLFHARQQVATLQASVRRMKEFYQGGEVAHSKQCTCRQCAPNLVECGHADCWEAARDTGYGARVVCTHCPACRPLGGGATQLCEPCASKRSV